MTCHCLLQLPHSCSSAENHQASKWSWSQNCYKLKNSWQYFCIPHHPRRFHTKFRAIQNFLLFLTSASEAFF
ncbi:hypothetical protein PSTT_04577 [Puccinia striiformis]|uniref:Uncharacterized protein n=1 Tax=Puccinia striiformis TaxID=27350 RepID=A0A2S4VSA3_9BASI|nr:hypothetical protein PSTT_04577 [Puccinia striiformis]